jgi:hypothetical protein
MRSPRREFTHNAPLCEICVSFYKKAQHLLGFFIHHINFLIIKIKTSSHVHIITVGVPKERKAA